ncbi:uncharacterized protein LOC126476887 [Schistocerca serialis cubense]|uniref:uncharacterized protein LOC126476887 n=1 Tax=Schistocerca serialis cubense TaxID=2023355 RepID=UPI00214E3288|nr:uncharacterized protein LOC126476887 [Schistocerca serialis cubense]
MLCANLKLIDVDNCLPEEERYQLSYPTMSHAQIEGLSQSVVCSMSKMKWRKSTEEFCSSVVDTLFHQAQISRHAVFLATGDSFKTISFSYRLGKSTVGAIVHDTSIAVIDLLLEEVMPVLNEEKWNAISEEFWTKWQFPNCIGSLDAKHVTIQAPNNSGSLYWNYKKTYYIVLLALVDPCYNFIAIDVGAYGKNSDGGILVNSNLGKQYA